MPLVAGPGAATYPVTGRVLTTYPKSLGPLKGGSSQPSSQRFPATVMARSRFELKGGGWNPSRTRAPELVYGTDASGGGLSEDPRLRVVSWGAIVGVIADGRLNVLGKASGRLPPGSSIAQGEASESAGLHFKPSGWSTACAVR